MKMSMKHWENDIVKRHQKYSRKTRRSVTVSTRNHTWSSPGLNWDLFCYILATNRLSHGTSNTHYNETESYLKFQFVPRSKHNASSLRKFIL